MKAKISRAKLSTAEKAIVLLAMIVLIPAGRLVLGVQQLLDTFMEWLKLEWCKMDMTPDEVELVNRKILFMRAESALGWHLRPEEFEIIVKEYEDAKAK